MAPPAFGTDGFARNADPRSLDDLGASGEQAGSRASKRVVAEAVYLRPIAGCRAHLPWQRGSGMRRRRWSANCMAWGASVVAGPAGIAVSQDPA